MPQFLLHLAEIRQIVIGRMSILAKKQLRSRRQLQFKWIQPWDKVI
jgi:hypothetical protein